MSRKRSKDKRRKQNRIDDNVVAIEDYYGKPQLPVKKATIHLNPRTENQRTYIDLLNDNSNSIIFATGPAGTGKTMIACLAALKAYSENKINKIILTRPVVEVDEKLGALPGNINDKMAPWTRPIFDVFKEYYSLKDLSRMINDGHIEISPLAYMRGRNFKDAFIILDEAQSTTTNQMLMALTRIGENSRMVVTGDPKQNDRSYMVSGLDDFLIKLNKFKMNKSCQHIQSVLLENKDICRSKAVVEILSIYNL